MGPRYSCGHISGPHKPIPTKCWLWMFFIMLHRYMVSKTEMHKKKIVMSSLLYSIPLNFIESAMAAGYSAIFKADPVLQVESFYEQVKIRRQQNDFLRKLGKIYLQSKSHHSKNSCLKFVFSISESSDWYQIHVSNYMLFCMFCVLSQKDKHLKASWRKLSGKFKNGITILVGHLVVEFE